MIIVITGPTAVGKTKMSIALARSLNGEIINADSTQVYKGMDIGTAKVTEKEKEGIPHHLFDICDVKDTYTAFDYQKDARKCIDELLKKGKTPILVGGTGLYIKAALYNYEFKIENEHYDFSDYTDEELYNELISFDPHTNIHPHNRKRLERALTLIKNNNGKISSSNKGNELLYDTIFIGLTTDRKILYERINKRVDAMVNEGLIKEAKSFYDMKMKTKAIMTPICYKELFNYFDGLCTLDEALDLIKTRSRRYAKRQYTWFNNQMAINWFQVDFDNFDKTIKEVLDFITK